MAQATEPAVTAEQIALLRFLATVNGADIYGYGDALAGRALEALGLATIIRAVNPPSDGAQKQPYFGACISEAGREFLATAQPKFASVAA